MKATSLTPNEFVDTFKYIHAMIGKARNTSGWEWFLSKASRIG